MPAARDIPDQLHGRPFSSREALALGVSQQMLRGRRFRRLWHDVYVHAAIPDSLHLRAHALALVLPDGAAFSHETATELLGLPGTSPLLHVSSPTAAVRGAPRHLVQWHESVPRHDVRPFAGVPLTTPARTFVDLAQHRDLVELTVLGDAILLRLATRTQLEEAVASARGRRGVVLARQVLPLLRERVDSPMETRLRLLLVLAGLPCPEVNVHVHGPDGRWLGRPDLVYRAAKIIIEYEGDQHRTDQQQWRNDLRRYEAFSDAGWLVIRVTADDVRHRPAETVARIRRLLAERLR